METVSLEFILNATGGRLSRACYNTKFDKISTDTRQITPGCLFLALRGERFDGNDFLEQAFEKGASACIAQRRADNGPVILVRDSVEALHRLAAAYRRRFDIPAVGVTGSVGKTSTKEMIACALGARYRVLKNEGNRNNGIGMPLSVFDLARTHTAAVWEMGMSGFGEISALSKIASPRIAVITNIGVSHLEKLGTRENILKAKLEIRDGMKPGGTLVLNADDVRLRAVKPAVGETVVTYGLGDGKTDFHADSISVEPERTVFRVTAGEETARVELPVCGRHHVYNALAAIACARLLGIPVTESAAALRGYTPTGLREKFVDFHGVRLIEDCYNASPDSMQSAFGLLAALDVPGRRIAVLGDMKELGGISPQAHFDTGVAARAAGVNVLLTLGPEARHIAEGFRSAPGAGEPECQSFDDPKELAAELAGRMEPGDTVLFKASRVMKLEDVARMACESRREP